MRAQAERFGTEFAAGTVNKVDLGQRPFVLELDGKKIHAETLIVATGATAKWLGLPEELEFRTKIGGVTACATCDGFFYKGKQVLVVGGGDTAMEEATFLTKFVDKVTIVHRRDELRASKAMQQKARSNPKIAWMFDTVIEKILGGPGLGVTGVVVRNVKTGVVAEIATGGIFMAIGHVPEYRARSRASSRPTTTAICSRTTSPRRPACPGCLRRATWPTTATGRRSPRPEAAAWPRWTPSAISIEPGGHLPSHSLPRPPAVLRGARDAPRRPGHGEGPGVARPSGRPPDLPPG